METGNTNFEEEKESVYAAYNELVDILKGNGFSEIDLTVIDKAFKLAVQAHGDVRRRSGELYIFHPISVAKISATELYLDAPAIAAALLHDVVEDTEYTLDDITEQFGIEISNIVDGLTKISGDPTEKMDEMKDTRQSETIKKILVSLSYDPRVILVKLADRLHNLRTIDSMPHEKQAKIAAETKIIYAPLALRLGYYKIRYELEDLCLKITDSDIYYFIKAKLETIKESIEEQYQKFISKLSDDIEKEGIKVRMYYDLCSISKIWLTMSDKNLSFDEIDCKYDIKMVIDCPVNLEKTDCWRMYSIISEHYSPKPNSLKDMISTPKANGYESIRVIFLDDDGQWIKVLIRSTRMDDIAEKGVAGLWKHRASEQGENKIDQWIKAMVDIMSNEKDESSIEFVENFKANLFNKEIYVYTPKGEMRTMPKGSTALDFAYAISSEIGNNCMGAIINNKLESINTELHTGDKIRILTSENQYPKQTWLNYAITPRALNHIKKALNKSKKSHFEEGKKMVEDWLKENKIEPNDANINKVLRLSMYDTLLDLFYNVAISNLKLETFKKYIKSKEKHNFFTSFFKTKDSAQEINIEEQTEENHLLMALTQKRQDILYTLCKYCNPIPGDDVIGFTNPDGAITVHRTNCEKALALMAKYGNKVIKAKWPKQESESGFLTGINIEGIDSQGLAGSMTQLIANNYNINIREISLKADNGIFHGRIILYVSDTNNLNTIIHALEGIKGIKKVHRINKI